jgi:hypothetical protein
MLSILRHLEKSPFRFARGIVFAELKDGPRTCQAEQDLCMLMQSLRRKAG